MMLSSKTLHCTRGAFVLSKIPCWAISAAIRIIGMTERRASLSSMCLGLVNPMHVNHSSTAHNLHFQEAPKVILLRFPPSHKEWWNVGLITRIPIKGIHWHCKTFGQAFDNEMGHYTRVRGTGADPLLMEYAHLQASSVQERISTSITL